MTTTGGVIGPVDEIASAWGSERAERQARRHLDPADFERLRATGLLALIVPVDHGGMWEDAGASARPLCETYRRLARADPSVALVSAMHPAVVMFWLASPDPTRPDWVAQRDAELAEEILLGVTRVLGGGTYSGRSPFAHWFEDVRALGFLRPPWGLAHDDLFATSLDG